MIGKAKAISHGINNLRYIMGESKRFFCNLVEEYMLQYKFSF